MRIFFFIFLLATNSLTFAFSGSHQSEPQPPSTPPTPIASTTIPPNPPIPPSSDELLRSFVRDELSSVDDYFSDKELLKDRSFSGTAHSSDQCIGKTPGDFTAFADPIGFAVSQGLVVSRKSLGGNESAFGVPSDAASTRGVSLLEHPFCPISQQSLTSMLGHSPTSQTLDLAQKFSMRANALREHLISNQPKAREESIRLWSRFFGCLSYVESLTTADTPTSDRIASEVAPADYRRPAGVLFYKDPRQSNPVSALNLGLFQFSPAAGGNVQACIRDWNVVNPQCSISRTANKDEMIRVLGAAYQDFNAYCGVQKVLQPFYVQINTRDRNKTPDVNWDGSQLKPSANRCVSLHQIRAYVHLGPLIDTTKQNLAQLLRCTLADN